MLKKTLQPKPKREYLTNDGVNKLQKEFQNLTEIKKPSLLKRIVRAREFGDVSENQEYQDAQNALLLIEKRIFELKKILKNYRVISSPQGADFIVIGSTVVVEMDNEIDEFTIVGTVEADPSHKKISDVSPLGRALLGAKIGETIEVFTPPVKRTCKVLEIK